MTESPWYAEHFDATYLEVYAHRDAAEAGRAVRQLLVPLGLAGRRVLDLACGAGRYLQALAAQGAQPVGVDLSLVLLHAARAAAAAPPALVRGDVRRLPFGSGVFDGVISMFTSFGYFATAAEDAAVLAEARRVLTPGGFLVVDVFNAAMLQATLRPESARRSGRWDVHERRWIAGDQVHKEMTLRHGGEVRRYREVVRLWPEPDLRRAMRAAGFAVIAVHGDYDGGAFAAGRSPRTIVVGRAA